MTSSTSNGGKGLIALAIFAGLGLIAVALYFALRPVGSEKAPYGEAPASSFAISESVVSFATAYPDLAATERLAEAALLEYRDARLIAECWDPLISAEPEPDHSAYSFQIVFDADGTEIARGISELRDVESRADVAECLRSMPLGLQIEPLGSTQTVELELVFGDLP